MLEVLAKCTKCGGIIKVDCEQKFDICKLCKKVIVTEDAINDFTNYYLSLNVTDLAEKNVSKKTPVTSKNNGLGEMPCECYEYKGTPRPFSIPIYFVNEDTAIIVWESIGDFWLAKWFDKYLRSSLKDKLSRVKNLKIYNLHNSNENLSDKFRSSNAYTLQKISHSVSRLLIVLFPNVSNVNIEEETFWYDDIQEKNVYVTKEILYDFLLYVLLVKTGCKVTYAPNVTEELKEIIDELGNSDFIKIKNKFDEDWWGYSKLEKIVINVDENSQFDNKDIDSIARRMDCLKIIEIVLKNDNIRTARNLKKLISYDGIIKTIMSAQEENNIKIEYKNLTQHMQWLLKERCYYCGGELKFWSGKCKSCGRGQP